MFVKNPQARIGLGQISFYIFCSFPAFIALHPKGMLAIVFLVLQVIALATKKNGNSNSGIWLPLLLSAPFIFYIVSLGYSSDVATGYKYVERTILLMVLPWLLYANRSSVTTLTLQNTLRFFAVIATGLTLYTVGSLIAYGTFQQAKEALDAYYWIRTDLEAVSGLHPTYFSLILGLALFAMLHEIKGKTIHGIKLIWAYVASVVLILGLLIASSKMILTCVFIGAIIIFSQGLSFKAIAIRFAALASVVLLLVLFVRPLRERVSTLIVAAAESGVEENNPDSLRKGIYKSGLEAISDNVWFGTGIGDYQHALNAKYEKYGYEIPRERSFNTHNQYLQVWLSVGIFPMILFVLSILAQFLIAFVSRHFLHLAFVVMMAFSFMTENVLARQDGIFIYAFFSSVFCYASWSSFKGMIFVNGRFLTQSLTGVQRYAHEITRWLTGGSCQVITLTPEKRDDGQQRVWFPFLKGQLWEQLLLPVYLKLCGSPLLVNLCNTAPLLYSNQIVTIHDVAFAARPQWFSSKFVRWYNFMIPKITKRARHIVTVSEFSKSELMRFYGISSSKISVLYNGVPDFIKQSQKDAKLVEGDYVLSVGSLSERKNQKSLIEAYLRIEKPKYKLVIAGRNNPDIFNNQETLLKQINASEWIVFLESPTDNQLANLYSNALFSVYIPSYEGFGIPVVESLAYGKPVLVSDIPVFQELFKDVAIFSKLDNIDNLRAKLEEVYNSMESLKEKVNRFHFEGYKYSYKESAKGMETLLKMISNIK